MSLDYRTENLYVPTPRSARFLRHTIKPARAAVYVPESASGEGGNRVAHHQPGTCGPDAWPVRLTRCGQHPGYFGDNQPVRTLQVAR